MLPKTGAPLSSYLSDFYQRQSGQIEAIQVHYLVPGSYEVMYELLLGVVLGIDFGQGTQLGVRAEDQVDTGAGHFGSRLGGCDLQDFFICGCDCKSSENIVE